MSNNISHPILRCMLGYTKKLTTSSTMSSRRTCCSSAHTDILVGVCFNSVMRCMPTSHNILYKLTNLHMTQHVNVLKSIFLLHSLLSIIPPWILNQKIIISSIPWCRYFVNYGSYLCWQIALQWQLADVTDRPQESSLGPSQRMYETLNAINGVVK